jgi:ppGpp synthetase/RelA/SpoT-type nucleotidyltranferase
MNAVPARTRQGTRNGVLQMTVIDEFLSQYRTQYDFYDNVARLVAQILDGNLQAAGIRSIVTSRAKSISRLEAKVKQRNKTANYATVAEIVNDVPDLAGVRVALFFSLHVRSSASCGRQIGSSFLTSFRTESSRFAMTPSDLIHVSRVC